MKTKFKEVVPVLPSQDLERDLNWYSKLGFRKSFGDEMYAGLEMNGIYLHLQWHADTEDDPLLGGSVVRIFVNDIEHYYQDLVDRKVLEPDSLRRNTPWGTHEFGLFDPNKNAIFFVEDI